MDAIKVGRLRAYGKDKKIGGAARSWPGTKERALVVWKEIH